jgi:RNA polymerase sigma factor (TIGR02999 family)
VSPETVGLTQLLRESRAGDRTAFDRVLSVVYNELRRQAGQYLKMQRPGHTLQPTALVHEAYLRLVSGSQPDWQDRAHFFGVAATVMRHILVDHARAQSAQKRGGGRERVEVNDALVYSGDKAGDLLAIHDALTRLADFDERKARVLELRYFGGLSMEEITRVLCTSAATVRRDLRYAEAWLRRELQRH